MPGLRSRAVVRRLPFVAAVVVLAASWLVAVDDAHGSEVPVVPSPTVAGSTPNTSPIPPTAPGNPTVTVTQNIRPATQYSFRVFAHDDLGRTSALSNAINVVTPLSDTVPLSCKVTFTMSAQWAGGFVADFFINGVRCG